MKIIEQHHEFIEEPKTEKDLYLKIERVARTCYKSEEKICDGSAERLISSLINREHEAMLEHGNIIMEVNENIFSLVKAIPKFTKYLNFTNENNRCLISGNVRAWRDYIKSTKNISTASTPLLFNFLRSKYPLLFEDLYENAPLVDNVLNFKILTEGELALGNEMIAHRRISVRFVTDRGVSHEIVRHRTASFAQESTRYVNYEDGIVFIKPVFSWASKGTEKIEVYHPWVHSMEESERMYQSMIANGASPQEARSVLPNSTKTEVVVTASIPVWHSIFRLRIDSAAHPQIRDLLSPVAFDI